MRTSWTVPTARLSHGLPFGLLRGGRAVAATLAFREQVGDPAHDQVGGLVLGLTPVEAGREDVGEAERGTDADRDPATGMRQLLAAGPALVGARDADRDDRRARAQRQHRDAIPPLPELPVVRPGPLGEDEQRMTLLEDPRREPESIDVGARAVDAVDAAVPGDPADD